MTKFQRPLFWSLVFSRGKDISRAKVQWDRLQDSISPEATLGQGDGIGIADIVWDHWIMAAMRIMDR